MLLKITQYTFNQICKSNKYTFHISLLTTTILLDGDFDIQNKTLE